ncbi:cytochrome P450 [Sphingomonadaceae bacterium G21617-S1]|nr:cytochrome P450 [Sphingomonadaceae bacterium G21617-S1]
MKTSSRDWSDIDHNIESNEFFRTEEYHETFREIRNEDPVHYSGGSVYGRPLWHLMRYNDIAAYLSDNTTFSSRHGGNLPPDPNRLLNLTEQERYDAGFGSSSTFTDAPRHPLLRQPMNKHFSVPAVARLTETIRRVTKQIVNEVEDRGTCDLVEDVAAQLPMRLVCEYMGVPRQDWDILRSFAQTYMGSTDPQFRREGMSEAKSQATARDDLYEYMKALAIDKRRNPGDDFTTVISSMMIEGEPWNDRDMGWWCFSMIAGGLETTRNAGATGMYTLIRNPDQADRIRQDYSLMPKAVEEILRWATPSKHKLRVATRDVELGGQLIRKDDWVVGWLISANRDEEIFDDPYKFDIARDPNPHMAFGVNTGGHYCLGRNLARLELKVLIEELLRRFGTIELDGAPEWLASSNTAGLKHLPIRCRA